LGITEGSAGRCSDSLSWLNKALAIAEQYNDQQGIAIISLNMGDTYMKTANYAQAQSSLRRARSLAELVGGNPIISLVLGNMGVLDIRTGNLAEAIDELKQAIILAEKHKELSSVSVCNAYLALALLEKGDIPEAKKALSKALMLSKSLNIYPFIGVSLVTIGYLRYIQSKYTLCGANKDRALLNRALNTLERAIKINGIEEEARTEGKILLSQIYMMQSNITASQEYLEQAIETAKKFELNWLVARAYHVKGNIFSAKKDYVNAKQFYMQSLQMARASDMRLEMARIYQDFGTFLLQEEASTLPERRDAHEYLKEAFQIFKDCGAALDMQLSHEEYEEQESFVNNKTS
jgi:tetratricopeptide (TPR) repeat protein